MKYGQEEGEICNRDGCIGKMYFFPEDTSPSDDSVFCDACYSIFNEVDVMTNEKTLGQVNYESSIEYWVIREGESARNEYDKYEDLDSASKACLQMGAQAVIAEYLRRNGEPFDRQALRDLVDDVTNFCYEDKTVFDTKIVDMLIDKSILNATLKEKNNG